MISLGLVDDSNTTTQCFGKFWAEFLQVFEFPSQSSIQFVANKSLVSFEAFSKILKKGLIPCHVPRAASIQIPQMHVQDFQGNMHNNVWCINLCIRVRSVIGSKPSDNSQILYLVHSVVAHFFKQSMSKMVCQQNLVPITHQVMCPICYNS